MTSTRQNPIVLAGLYLAFSAVNSLYASAASVSLQCWSDEARKAGAPSDFDIVERSDGAVTLQVRPSYTLWPGACLREVLVSGIKSESPDGESLTYSFKPILLHHVWQDDVEGAAVFTNCSEWNNPLALAMDGFISSSRIGDTLNYLTVTINPQAPSKAQLEDRFLERDHSVFNPAAVGAKWHDPAGSPWDRSLTCAYGK